MTSDPHARRGLPPRLAEGIKGLDRHQKKALVAEGNLVIVAGPGSGKTRTVVTRAGYLLETRISPLRGLAAITYTNQAATELQEGLARLGVREPQRLFAGTLHSFCLAQILPYARLVGVELPSLDALMNDKEEKALLQECADDENIDFYAFREIFTSLRRRLAADEDVSDHPKGQIRAAQRYEMACEQSGIWDFEGIVLAAVRLLREHPEVAAVVKARFPVVIVDEYQDLGAGLHRLVETLLAAGVEITAVGDVDQSIYGWAGGAPEYLDALCERSDFTVQQLVTNYRCGSAVVAAAEIALAQQRGWQANPNREDPGTLEFQVADGDIQQQAEQAAQSVLNLLNAGVAPHEVAVLLRYRLPLGPLIEQRLAEAGVPVRFDGQSTAVTTELGRWLEAAALYATCLNPGGHSGPPPLGASALLDRFTSLERTAGRPRSAEPRLVRVASLHKTLLAGVHSSALSLRQWSQRVVADLDLLEIAKSIGDPRTLKELNALTSAPDELLLSELASDTAGTGKVVICTYHNAKGRTFTAVILPGLTEGVVPPWDGPPWDRRPLKGSKLAEERRNFYVALTRSRGSVLLQLSPTGQDAWKKTVQHGYSSFALELATSLGHSIGPAPKTAAHAYQEMNPGATRPEATRAVGDA
ncbi:ATP-dependent helicase [Rhodococcus sp. A5(2022)]|uniref:ATP-dependent helicase n=1 Tax=Rhodococcus sp. A5(2022) TaxID=3003588 RepID=UPI0022A8CF1F|nr:ATP-dependent helicase [Rhodococcus sp. A5(2022)]MCZ1075260.1 ATP-dependent helicase [Rhodococcus sp. A5(2022)]